MPDTINELKWVSLTAAVNEMKSPNNFLRRLLWSNHQTLPTEDIELSVINRDREIAPFVRKNGEGIMVPGYTSTNQMVVAPNIRIKRPFTPSELLFGRRPGTVIHLPSSGQQISAIRQHIARDLQGMADMVVNAEEFLCALALQGTITYSVADGEVFQITFPKPSGNNITLSTFWDDATPDDTTFHEDIHAVKKVMSDEVGLAPTDCIMGTTAATAFRKLIVAGKVLIDNRYLDQGTATFTQQFSEDGVIFLGAIDSIRFWEYGRTAKLNGVAKDMIRPKYAEFVSLSPASERVLYYGAIADMDALEGRLFQGERFSKSWTEKDPSVMNALLAARPLPVPRRPGATVSVKVAT